MLGLAINLENVPGDLRDKDFPWPNVAVLDLPLAFGLTYEALEWLVRSSVSVVSLLGATGLEDLWQEVCDKDDRLFKQLLGKVI